MERELIQGRKKAMALLGHRDRTRWELQDRMERAGFSREAIEDALSYVESFHYVDDLRYARQYVDIYRERRSMARIQQELRKRHVPEEYIDAALAEAGWDDSAALAGEVRRLCRSGAPASYEEKQKLAAKLYRRGFRREDILQALQELAQPEEGDR